MADPDMDALFPSPTKVAIERLQSILTPERGEAGCILVHAMTLKGDIGRKAMVEAVQYWRDNVLD